MELASSFNFATLFKQLISSGSTSKVLSLSFHPINFTSVIMSAVADVKHTIKKKP